MRVEYHVSFQRHATDKPTKINEHYIDCVSLSSNHCPGPLSLLRDLSMKALRDIPTHLTQPIMYCHFSPSLCYMYRYLVLFYPSHRLPSTHTYMPPPCHGWQTLGFFVPLPSGLVVCQRKLLYGCNWRQSRDLGDDRDCPEITLLVDVFLGQGPRVLPSTMLASCLLTKALPSCPIQSPTHQ